MKWREVSLNEICTTQYGYTASAREEEVGPKMLRITDIVPESINWSSVPFCEIDETEILKYQLSAGDILIARTGNTTGYAKLIRDDIFAVFASYLVRLKVDQKIANPQYIGRLVESKVYKNFVNSIKGGSAQGNANAKTLTMFKLKLPPLPTQQKIADILSKYDDLIENNRRRIELLEESARLLYREWFVYLRFPGHEHTPIIDGIPEGWEKKTLAELSDSVSYGYTAQSSLEPIGTKYLRITDIVPSIIDWESVPYCSISENDFKKFCLQEGDILVARTGATVGYAKRIGKLTYNSVFASYLVRFRFNNKLNNVIMGVFMESENYKKFVRNNAGGAAQPNANAKILSSATILVPPKLIQNNFSEIVEPINYQKEILQEQNQKLQKARDILIPRLMNGEINV